MDQQDGVIVDTSQAQTNVIVATAGSTSKTNIIIVQSITLGIASTNVFVNSDDDNGNGVPDVEEPLTGSGSAVAGEDDLVNITLQVQNSYTNATVTLSATPAGYGGGRIRVWPTAHRGPGTPLIDTGDWDACSTNWPGNAMPTNLWVEGVGPSTSVGDVMLTLSTPFCSVSTNLTVIDVTSVVWEAVHSPLTNNASYRPRVRRLVTGVPMEGAGSWLHREKARWRFRHSANRRRDASG